MTIVDTHERVDNEHTHDKPASNLSPQPVVMGVAAALVPMEDGSDRVMVTFTSVNGSWTVFYDRQGAIAHAQTLLGLAYQPPVVVPNALPDDAAALAAAD